MLTAVPKSQQDILIHTACLLLLIKDKLCYTGIQLSNNVQAIKVSKHFNFDWGEPHTSERFRRVNHARQKMDKNDCQLKYHTSSTKSRKNHSVDY